MKVKIGHQIFDSTVEPIMLILDKIDKKNIKDMLATATQYCSYPEGMDSNIIRDWMEAVE